MGCRCNLMQRTASKRPSGVLQHPPLCDVYVLLIRCVGLPIGTARTLDHISAALSLPYRERNHEDQSEADVARIVQFGMHSLMYPWPIRSHLTLQVEWSMCD